MGRPSWRSSFLGDASAKLLRENRETDKKGLPSRTKTSQRAGLSPSPARCFTRKEQYLGKFKLAETGEISLGNHNRIPSKPRSAVRPRRIRCSRAADDVHLRDDAGPPCAWRPRIAGRRCGHKGCRALQHACVVGARRIPARGIHPGTRSALGEVSSVVSPGVSGDPHTPCCSRRDVHSKSFAH